MSLEIAGVIDTTFIDSKHHNVERIKFRDNTGLSEQWVLGLYENTQKGDSIYKATGSMAVYLYKQDTTLVFYPVCNGDTLK